MFEASMATTRKLEPARALTPVIEPAQVLPEVFCNCTWWFAPPEAVKYTIAEPMATSSVMVAVNETPSAVRRHWPVMDCTWGGWPPRVVVTWMVNELLGPITVTAPK